MVNARKEFEEGQKLIRRNSTAMEIVPSFKNLGISEDEEQKINSLGGM